MTSFVSLTGLVLYCYSRSSKHNLQCIWIICSSDTLNILPKIKKNIQTNTKGNQKLRYKVFQKCTLILHMYFHYFFQKSKLHHKLFRDVRWFCAGTSTSSLPTSAISALSSLYMYHMHQPHYNLSKHAAEFFSIMFCSVSATTLHPRSP